MLNEIQSMIEQCSVPAATLEWTLERCTGLRAQSECFKLTKCMGLRVRSKCFKLTESPLSLSVPGRACWWVYPSRGETLQTEFYKCAHSSGRHRFRSPPCPEASRTYTNKYSHSPNYPEASRTQTNKCNTQRTNGSGVLCWSTPANHLPPYLIWAFTL